MPKKDIVLNIHKDFISELKDLPWDLPLKEWDSSKIKFLSVRKGNSKHTVRFIKTKNYSFAIKQTEPIPAYFESETYARLLERGVHTLIPAGYVIYKKDLFEKGKSDDSNSMAFMVTILEDKSIPHSILFKWDFTEGNRYIIYASIAELLANLHHNNVYWGDASLANVLVKFIKEKDDKGRVKTLLKAFLSDAETIELLDEINDEMREKDLRYFFKSLELLNEEIKNEGADRQEIIIQSEKDYIHQKYDDCYLLFSKIKHFAVKTGISVKKHFYKISDHYAVDALLKQIEEHKWYMNEQIENEITLAEAAEDWIEKIYNPIIDEFNSSKIFEYFPDTNSVKLYTDIMAHKYYLSLEEDKDVGIVEAIRSYGKKYSNREAFVIQKFIEKLLKKIISIVPPSYNL